MVWSQHDGLPCKRGAGDLRARNDSGQALHEAQIGQSAWLREISLPSGEAVAGYWCWCVGLGDVSFSGTWSAIRIP